MGTMKDNFGQALYDMLGIGNPEEGAPAAERLEGERAAAGKFEVPDLDDEEQETAPAAPAAPAAGAGAPYFPGQNRVPAPEPFTDLRVEKAIEVHSYEGTYLAAGTMMVGNLTARGDVEVAGDFEGAIIAKGKVTLHSNINSKVTATGLVLMNCNLVGDVDVSGLVELDEQSTITGNVHAESMVCSGKVRGDLDIQDSLTLDGYAQIDGNIKVDTMSMARGAKIAGSIEMQNLKK